MTEAEKQDHKRIKCLFQRELNKSEALKKKISLLDDKIAKQEVETLHFKCLQNDLKERDRKIAVLRDTVTLLESEQKLKLQQSIDRDKLEAYEYANKELEKEKEMLNCEKMNL